MKSTSRIATVVIVLVAIKLAGVDISWSMILMFVGAWMLMDVFWQFISKSKRRRY